MMKSQTWPPTPKSSSERLELRKEMVSVQLIEPRDTRSPITDQRVIEAMLTTPRHAFVPEEFQEAAYEDRALPIGYDQTISQPYIVALMTQLLCLSDQSHVLEVGTGSGYQAAVLSHITPSVFTIEIVPELFHRTQSLFIEEGYHNIRMKFGDGHSGWPEHAPYDAIIATCAEHHIPSKLWQQLAIGGRMVIPIGEKQDSQRLTLLVKGEDGSQKTKDLIPVRFVPMTSKVLTH